jgi:1-deoxy-D-xylulose-5-phosphate synthase
MGFHYLGPVDGHRLDDLHHALLAAKSINKPVLLHIQTVKGKGCDFAEKNPDTYHGVSRFETVVRDRIQYKETEGLSK